MKAIKFLLITIIVASWIFSGWPRFGNLPPEIYPAQAAISLVNCGTVVEVDKNNMAVVGIPAGIQNNDILVTYVHTRDNIDSTMPADWTNNVFGNDGTNNRLEIFWKRTTGTESAPTVTHSGGNSSITRMCAFRGIDTAGDPFNAVGSVQSNAGSPISTAAITTTVDGAMILHVFGSQDDNTWGSYTGTPTNEATQDMNALGTDDSLVMTYGLQVSAGSTGLAGATQTARGPDAGASVQLSLRPLPTTTIGNGTNPSNITIAPGASATDLDSFTLKTSFGTDTITAATVTLSSGSSGGLSLVAITSDNGVTTYCSQANPASDTVSLSGCNIPVTSSLTQFKVRVTPKSHIAMPPPPGSTYTVTGTITSFTGTNAQAGTDTSSATVTIDNLSPANVTSASGVAGNQQVSLSWANPADSDFHSVVVLRRASSAVTDTPVEGTVYTVGNTIGSSVVACVGLSPAVNCTDTGLSNGTAYHYKIFSRDTNVNYSTGAVPSGSPFTPVVPADVTAPSAVADLTASSPSQASVHLSWTAPGDDNNSGTATSYDIRYSTSNITDANWSSATQVNGEPAPSVAGFSESMTVTGLSANTTYYFAMKTSDEVPNTSGLSNVTNATTLIATDTTAPAAVSNLTVASPTTSSLNLSWTAPGDDNNSGTATSYDIRYSTSNITDANWSSATQVNGEPAPSVAGFSESMTVTGLSANTTYYFAMKTSDEASNESGLSNIANGTTSAEPSAPSAAPSVPSSGVAPRRVTFSGRAYPGSTMEVLRKSVTDELYRQTPTESMLINEDGTFYISYTGVLGADYFFALQVQDKDGRSTGILAYNAPLFGDVFEVKDILIPPTIGFNKSLVAKNEAVKIMGYAIPNSVVELEIDGSKHQDGQADQSGFWSFNVDTLSLDYGVHTARVRQTTPDDKLSNFSLARTFKLSSLVAPKADLNNDGTVNISDWSIFLVRWGSADNQLRLQNDLNEDGVTNILDFSIFLAAMKI